jgi:PST family polysaccharide transporter/lipopolysaccharide exporter
MMFFYIRDINLFKRKMVLSISERKRTRELSLMSFFTFISSNIITIIAGASTSLNELGLFTRSKQLSSMVFVNISQINSQVMYPVLAKFKDNENKLRAEVVNLISQIYVLITPIIYFLIFHTETVISILLGPNWANAEPFLKLFFISQVLLPVQGLLNDILALEGRSTNLLFLEIFLKFIPVCLLYYIGVTNLIYLIFAIIIGNSIIILGLCFITAKKDKKFNWIFEVIFRSLFPLFLFSALNYIILSFIFSNLIGIEIFIVFIPISLAYFILFYIFYFKIRASSVKDEKE